MKALSILLTAVCSAGLASPQTPAGLPNFHKVDESVYRGGQPTQAGFRSLAAMGVKTVIDLREVQEHSVNLERRWVESDGMKFVSVPLKGMSAPTDASIVKILAILDNSSAGPIFVHCRRGADRTGTVIACYRISHDHWTNHSALKEARGLGMRFFEWAMQGYILRYPNPTLAPNPSIRAEN